MTAARTAERTDHPTSEGRPGPGPGMLASFRAEKSAEPGRVSSPGACANVGLAVTEHAKPAHVMISWGTANPRERRPRVGEGGTKIYRRKPPSGTKCRPLHGNRVPGIRQRNTHVGAREPAIPETA